MRLKRAISVLLALCVLSVASVCAAQVKVSTGKELPQGTVGIEYYAKLEATGANDIVFSLMNSPDTPNEFPASLTLSENGEITGVPLEAGVFFFSVWASYVDPTSSESYDDQIAKNGVRTDFMLTILGSEEILPIILTTEWIPTATEGEPYAASIEADGAEPLSYAIYISEYGQNDFPGEMTFSSDGVISGTPLHAGTYSFWIEVSNEYESVQRSYTLIVEDKPETVAARPVINAQPQGAYVYKNENAVLSVSVVTPGDGTLTYQWYTAADSVSPATPIANATNSTYTADTSEVGSRAYYVVITNTVGESARSVSSDTVLVTVGIRPVPEQPETPEPANELKVPLIISCAINAVLMIAVLVLAIRNNGRHTPKMEFDPTDEQIDE